MKSDFDCEVIVVGAGVAGIGAGIGLQRAGFPDYLILDKAQDVGGTWRDHIYPGLTVDIPSLTYSFSFEQKPDWSSIWAPQAEVLDYLRHCVRKYGLTDRIRFGQEVESCEYDASSNVWITTTTTGEAYRSRYVINGSGYLNTACWPDIEGFDTFAGTKMHTSGWAAGLDLRGQRVAIIGTGATGIQVAPEVAAVAGGLHIFQRTPIWLLPKPPLKLPKLLKSAFRFVPGLQSAARLAVTAFMDLVFFRVFTNYRQAFPFARLMEKACLSHLKRQVDDPVTRDKLTPEYSWGCKRPSFSNAFYPIFNRATVDLVTEPILKVTPTGIVTDDGVERRVDTIICATGYQPFEKGSLPTYLVRGVGGQELGDYWDRHRYQAFRGFAVNGFPNYFLIFGPYSVASASYFSMVEVAMNFITRCLQSAREHGTDYVEVTADAQRRDHEDVLRKKQKSIWTVGNCATSNSFYYDRFGDTPGFRPSYQPLELWASWTTGKRTYSFDPVERVGRRPAELLRQHELDEGADVGL
jgi:cation diffusion facilitator CzcD-associated flavoprotein CzcO